MGELLLELPGRGEASISLGCMLTPHLLGAWSINSMREPLREGRIVKGQCSA
ncbi:hypothetical protein LJR225_001344 [Phenylobacterium sp. LjRoot225]|uniref:hypothetical protein n=1 Tax=Phenylobacterium sp. LjRoot225 TaxID=3342285 RepID=UPI003ED054E1